MSANGNHTHSDTKNAVSRAYKDGAAQGTKDASANFRIRYLPSLIKSLVNDRYRTEYVRGYKDAYFRTQRKIRQSELKRAALARSDSPQRER